MSLVSLLGNFFFKRKTSLPVHYPFIFDLPILLSLLKEKEIKEKFFINKRTNKILFSMVLYKCTMSLPILTSSSTITFSLPCWLPRFRVLPVSLGVFISSSTGDESRPCITFVTVSPFKLFYPSLFLYRVGHHPSTRPREKVYDRRFVLYFGPINDDHYNPLFTLFKVPSSLLHFSNKIFYQ